MCLGNADLALGQFLDSRFIHLVICKKQKGSSRYRKHQSPSLKTEKDYLLSRRCWLSHCGDLNLQVLGPKDIVIRNVYYAVLKSFYSEIEWSHRAMFFWSYGRPAACLFAGVISCTCLLYTSDAADDWLVV